MATESVSREELYELVWSEPMTKVGTRFDVSSSFLARVCARLNVPRPPRGYWAKLAVGKARPKPPLPAPRPGDEHEWTRGGVTPHAPSALPKPPAPIPVSPVPPASKRSTTHPLLAGARQFFDGAREAESGHLRPAKRRLVDLYVSNATLGRGLAFANKLFTSLENNGHRVTLAPFQQGLGRPAVDERIEGGQRDDYGYGYGKWNPDRPTVVYIGTVAIGLSLYELSEEVELRYVDGKYVPVKQLTISQRVARNGWNTWTTKRHLARGKLCLRASSPYSVAKWEQLWRETTKGELASKIPAIVEDLTAAAGTVAKLVEEGRLLLEQQQREWQLQQERWEREERERQRTEDIRESRDELFAIIEDWGIAKRTEEFFTDIEHRLTDAPDEESRAMLVRLQQARALLGGLDALKRFSTWRSAEER